MDGPANRRTTAPLILGIVLLLLPLLYVGAYLALVVPPGANPPWNDAEFWKFNSPGFRMMRVLHLKSFASAELINEDFGGEGPYVPIYYYRWGGRRTAWFFWPVEQLDRRVRPLIEGE
jgi:hypothetical protein